MLGSCLHHFLQVVIRSNDLLLREIRTWHNFGQFIKGRRPVPATDLRNIPFVLLVGRCEVLRLPLLTAFSPLPFPAYLVCDLLESLKHLVESVGLTR
jgi:hypothetical protein